MSHIAASPLFPGLEVRHHESRKDLHREDGRRRQLKREKEQAELRQRFRLQSLQETAAGQHVQLDTLPSAEPAGGEKDWRKAAGISSYCHTNSSGRMVGLRILGMASRRVGTTTNTTARYAYQALQI